ncbi:single-stranded DNA-binding protein [Clostridioides difficile]|nr:single-stranded DNA-binding protein [Clostridioides difficile]MDI3004360.1 single-stranded DNA-binding protein [Clostridioides difficile]
MINNINIEGNLVSDGTFRNSESGSLSYFNTIALNSVNSKGERERYFFPIRAHGKLALYMAKTARKGNEITISGSLTQNPLNKEINILVNKYTNHDLNRVKVSRYSPNSNSYNQGNGYNQSNNNQGNHYSQSNNSYDQGNGYNQNNNNQDNRHSQNDNPYNQGNHYSQSNNSYNQENSYNQNNNNQDNRYSQNDNLYNQDNHYNQNNSSYNQRNSYNQNNNNQDNRYSQNDNPYNQSNNNPYNQGNNFNQNNNQLDPYNWTDYDESKSNKDSREIDCKDFSGLYV